MRPGNRLDITDGVPGTRPSQAEASGSHSWTGCSARQDFTFRRHRLIRSVPARHRWDPAFSEGVCAERRRSDDRPGAPADNMFWSANLGEAGISSMASIAWLPAALLQADRREQLADALFAASRHWTVDLHFQKGLAGAPAEAIAAARDTAMNPAVLDAFALAIIAGEGPPAFPGLPGHDRDLAAARHERAASPWR